MVALSLFEVKEGGGGPIYKSKTNIMGLYYPNIMVNDSIGFSLSLSLSPSPSHQVCPRLNEANGCETPIASSL